ncbi:protein tiptop isoform X1 [Cherax quadricarinatus]|nr:protein tiptop-like isoform X1 [Cherax quadricarinatus]
MVTGEECEGKEPGIDGEEGDSVTSSPRHRRDSGSVASREGLSPKMSPRHSPRESLNSSPAPLGSPRATPPALRPLTSSPSFMRVSDNEADILDFSLRRSPTYAREDNLSISARSSLAGSPPPGLHRLGDSPLDLSVPRKRAADALLEAAQNKMHHDLAKGLGAWGIPLPPHLASAMALRPDLAALKPELPLWNGKIKSEGISTKLPAFPMGAVPPSQSEGSRALERMSELSRLGGDSGLDLFRSGLSGSSGRATAWQSHWLSKGQDATKDVLKCVWCKASFNTLAELTTHMKEAKHCGVNLPPPIPPPSSSATSIHTHLPPQYTPNKTPTSKAPSSSSSIASGSSSSSDLMSSIKETMPLPRKLVRGQDVWLGKGAEQTRQILKCMWCGQSFKSLAEMTQHMQQTQHYTNIISQEQIISWKSPEEKSSSQSHVNAVLTCKVCDQAFASLKELSNHMVKNAHYKEHIMRSITESGARRRQTREKRKKSLPVRKLLELERAQQEYRSSSEGGRGMKEHSGSGRISCEKCGDKIETSLFVDHIRNCVGASSRDLLKSALLSPDSDYSNKLDSAPETDSEGKKTPEKTPRDSPRERDFDKPKGRGASESPSVLNALEKLIEKSFDSGKAKPGAGPLGSSILRRLGIDESADYSKPLMDPQLVGMYATFSRLHGVPPHGAGTPSTFNLPPSFGSSDRGSGLRGLGDSMMSPSADSDTRDTFPRSPSRPGSRPASTGSITRDGSGSERSLELLRPDSHPAAATPEEITPTENGADHSDNEHGSLCGREEVKQEPLEINGEASDRESLSAREDLRVKEEIRVKEEFKLKEEGDEDENDLTHDIGRESPAGRLMGSPAGCSSRSGTPHSEASVGGRSGSGLGAAGLGGLSALLGGGGGGGEGSSSHPLAALQKLCDKTETQPRPPPVSGASAGPQTNPGAILAFSWACNDAVTADSIMKCAFCDTPFISKGAYRHHLSKMHFVKDGVVPENAGGKASSGKPPPAATKAATPPAPPVEESPHSKFLKYTELAKQLSSK